MKRIVNADVRCNWHLPNMRRPEVRRSSRWIVLKFFKPCSWLNVILYSLFYVRFSFLFVFFHFFWLLFIWFEFNKFDSLCTANAIIWVQRNMYFMKRFRFNRQWWRRKNKLSVESIQSKLTLRQKGGFFLYSEKKLVKFKSCSKEKHLCLILQRSNNYHLIHCTVQKIHVLLKYRWVKTLWFDT